jgi:hypothetical protein
MTLREHRGSRKNSGDELNVRAATSIGRDDLAVPHLG